MNMDKKLIKRTIFCLIILVCLAAVPEKNEPGDIPNNDSRVVIYNVVPDRYDSMIVNVLKIVINSVYDLNRDNKINCIDHAVLFKKLWDEKYPAYKHQCVIVRNYNPKKNFHHLYIAIIDDNYRVYYVEPWVENPYRYRTTQAWKMDSLDHNYDIWDETRYWLERAKR